MSAKNKTTIWALRGAFATVLWLALWSGAAGAGADDLAGRPRLAPFAWREAAPGFETARAEISARFGPRELVMLRFDPARYLFKPYRESEFAGPAHIEGWAARLPAALAAINAGQYYPDRRPMGRMSRDGLELSPEDHARWQGFLVSGPRPEAPPGLPRATLIDRAERRRELKPDHYLNVTQSFMILDSQGRVRVRDTDKLAARSAVGEDKSGRILLLMTPAAVSLYDLAQTLRDPKLELVRALGLDGGFEAQLFWRGPQGPAAVSGDLYLRPGRAVYLPGYRPSLPSVLAAEPAAPSP